MQSHLINEWLNSRYNVPNADLIYQTHHEGTLRKVMKTFTMIKSIKQCDVTIDISISLGIYQISISFYVRFIFV